MKNFNKDFQIRIDIFIFVVNYFFNIFSNQFIIIKILKNKIK